MTRFTPLLAMALALAACNNSPDKPAGAETPAAGAASGWNPLDACATLGKPAAGKAMASEVTSAELGTVVPGTEGTAAFSMCTFKFADGATLMLLTREAPNADAIAAAITEARTAGGTLPPATDVAGLGKAALWSDASKGLQVFLDDRRYVSINVTGVPGDGKAQATAVARALT